MVKGLESPIILHSAHSLRLMLGELEVSKIKFVDRSDLHRIIHHCVLIVEINCFI